MNDGSTYNKNYSAEELRAYISGQMPPAEMHALEKAALDDPFLEEAIEGMREALSAHGAEKVMAPVAELKAAMAEKATRPKVIPMFQRTGFRMAAAAVVILVAGTWIYNTLSQQEPANTLAVQPGTEQSAPIPSVDNNVTADTTAAAAINNKNNTIALKPAEPVYPAQVLKEVPVKSKAATKDLAATPPAAPALLQDSSLKELNTETAKAGAIVKAEEKKQNDALEETIAANNKADEGKARTMNVANNFFKGKVVDPANNPLANVTITPLNSNQSFLTDQNGMFQIPVVDSPMTVVVSTVGYTTRNYQLNNQGFMNQLSLEPLKNDNLSGVVIAQPSRKKESFLKKPPTVLVQTATPEGGWVAFENYVEANNKLKAQKQTQVVVSFAIDRKNALSDFRIEQSAGAAQDAEAIRLIKEGPAWKLNKTRKDRVMVIIRF